MKKLGWVVLAALSYSSWAASIGCGGVSKQELDTVKAELLAPIAPVAAEVVRLEITGKTPYGTFRPGEYVLWRGKVHGELAPGEAIPDLDKARRNEAGKVEYSAEIMLLMPADPSKGNGTLLVDIPNRGRVYGIALYNGPRGEPFNSGNIQQGTGFLEDRGFSLAEVQWELGKGVELPSFTGPDGKTRYVEGAGFAIVRDTADFLNRSPRIGARSRNLSHLYWNSSLRSATRKVSHPRSTAITGFTYVCVATRVAGQRSSNQV